MKAVRINRVLVAVAIAAALGVGSPTCPAGTLRVVHSIDFPGGFTEPIGRDLAWDGSCLWTTINSTHPYDGRLATVRLDPTDGSLVSSTLEADVLWSHELRGHNTDYGKIGRRTRSNVADHQNQ
jgi:hypothetical protein